MDFKSLMRINSAATIVAGTIAVLMAYAGLGVWSLVAQFMIAAAVSTGLLWLNGSWQPSLAFSTQSFRRMFGFGSKLTLESTLNVLYENYYVLVIGRIFSAEATGLRSEEHTSELQSLMRLSYAVFCLKKKTKQAHQQ